MHAFLITGGTKDQRLAHIADKQKEWKISAFDYHSLLPIEHSIGIANVRDFQSQLLLSPYNSPKKLGIIEEAHTMTIEAQNALLKTLEEPPNRTVLFLECPVADALLPTILSRCTVVNLGIATTKDSADALAQCLNTLEHIAREPIGKRIALVDEIAKTREEAKHWVELAIMATRQNMLAHPTDNHHRLVRSLLAAQSQLSANVTPKLVLDNVFLSLL